jgi:hypothetical protein
MCEPVSEDNERAVCQAIADVRVLLRACVSVCVSE